MKVTPFPIQTLSLSNNNSNQSTMSRSLFRTLIRSTSTSIRCRRISTEPSYVEVSVTESNLVEKIEDAIHRNIVRRSEPDWLPFMPGASYWVPPRRPSYGVAEMVNKLTNPLNEEQAMAVTSMQGWPSSDFYLHNEVQVSSSDAVQVSSSDSVEESSSDTAEDMTSSTAITVVEEES